MTTDIAAGIGGDNRLHAMDALRGGALLLGVAFHATLSFMEPPFWVVGDNSTSPVMNAVYFVLHIFRMTLFFLIAGFFGRMLLHRRGTPGFVRDRAKRILAPLLIFWPVVMVMTVIAIIWADAQAGKTSPPAAMTLRTFPLTHLWFLYYLLLLYVGALALRGIAAVVDRTGAGRARIVDPLVRGIVRADLTPLVLGAPLCLTLILKSGWALWFGVPAAENGLLPNAGALVAYATAFGFGWLLQRQSDLLRLWERRWRRYLVAAVVLTGAALWLAGTAASFDTARSQGAKVGYAIVYVLAIWAWTMGIVGLAVRYLSVYRAPVRYVADASYWIYISHLPVVMLLQAAFMRVPLPWLVKYVLILAIAFPVLLLSYRYLVRYTFLGSLLNGRRLRRQARPTVEAALATE
ncbi:acyltransferase family protein [Dactylosporangium sp. NPDC000555]|uniref:acyltransferase family protein n=1 Tax=Dactylosporangium sp. NPDC000555 TaxID=3154260 RepID=UPI00332277E9